MSATLKLALALGLCAGLAQAQYSTPVREVTNPINSLAGATCYMGWTAAENGSSSCILTIGDVDKRFIINAISFHCEGGSGVKFAHARIGANFPPESSELTLLYLPLLHGEDTSGFETTTDYTGVVTGLMIETKPVSAGTKPQLTATVHKQGSANGSCTVIFHGNVQPK